MHYPSTYLAGCYNRLPSVIDGTTLEHEDLVNAPNWLPLTLAGRGYGRQQRWKQGIFIVQRRGRGRAIGTVQLASPA